jgi:preprotein translocase subunit SecA
VAAGLDGPSERVPLVYSAPSADGDGAVVTNADVAGRRSAAAPAKRSTSPNTAPANAGVNREERRKAAKQAKKRH